MLVLTRRVGIQHQDTIVIGTDIEITVVEVRGDQVRIGIQAPRHVTVHRTEIYEQIQQENRAAASASPSSVPRTNPRPSSRS